MKYIHSFWGISKAITNLIWSDLIYIILMICLAFLFTYYSERKNNVYITVCIHINILPTNVASQMSYLDYLVHLDMQYPKCLQVYKGGAMAQSPEMPWNWSPWKLNMGAELGSLFEIVSFSSSTPWKIHMLNPNNGGGWFTWFSFSNTWIFSFKMLIFRGVCWKLPSLETLFTLQ